MAKTNPENKPLQINIGDCKGPFILYLALSHDLSSVGSQQVQPPEVSQPDPIFFTVLATWIASEHVMCLEIQELLMIDILSEWWKLLTKTSKIIKKNDLSGHKYEEKLSPRGS